MFPGFLCVAGSRPEQHKEPKLEMAKRVISGPLFKESWVELDEEVKEVEARRRKKEQQQQQALTQSKLEPGDAPAPPLTANEEL